MNGCKATGALIVLTLLLAAATSHAAYSVKAAIVMDMNSRQILYEQNADKLIAPASLTKILTMYLVWEEVLKGHAKLSDKVTVSRKAASTGGSSMKLKRGEAVTVSELMHGMAIPSGNDACVAVAEYLDGSVSRFVKRMNRKARALGMFNTTFKNPNGLPAKGQLTTARDILTLSESYLRNFPYALEIHSKRYMYHNKYKRTNSNKLLGVYPGMDGLKTGYVASSGFNIVVTAQRNGRRLLAVVLGGKTSRLRNDETKKLLDTCFAQVTPPQIRLANRNTRNFSNNLTTTRRVRQALPQPEVASAGYGSGYDNGYGGGYGNGYGSGYEDIQPVSYGDSYVLHESSWRSTEKALSRVNALRRRGVRNVRAERVDLGDKGIWHRVYIGSFSDMAQARRYKQSLLRSFPLKHVVIVQLNS